MTPRLTMVAATARNGVIGAGNRLPWRLSGDLKRFKAATTGKAMILGRKTMDSIGRLLPGRPMIVLTSNPHYSFPGAHVARSVDESVAMAGSLSDPDEAMVIGGEAIYRAFFPLARSILLTVVDCEPLGDAVFPFDRFAECPFEVIDVTDYSAGTHDEFACSVYRLEGSSPGNRPNWFGAVQPGV
jgi:dihydrofolate reductase